MILRLVTFCNIDTDICGVGALVEEGVVDLQAAAAEQAALPGRWDNSLVTVLSNLQWVQWAKQIVDEPRADWLLKHSAVKLLPPVPNSGKLLLLAGNYVEHLREAGSFEFQKRDEALPEDHPQVFLKPTTDTLIPHLSYQTGRK